ncbi:MULTISPECIES: 3-deoxy-7-phosphoheptulonate synthase [Thermoanaerobacterium]|uniref:3-deoxy-7-phosphoheptulonate synthase n=1 Tax=Thermoanaerobacterium butyriciformans TaxID=1702242 RepID=A0ABS4ND79_9THEO|nr:MULTISPECIES: 3-deoxy-7-phosphoheptulonate synthase [Thermoanaerobacterium]MBE0068736.1 3-deoxy-7-phosphoheptulonate synthase [Thermoanaerobacterium thermosaccharolyticum]MBE0228665.1 3-deoxy-7-phosphoheptulonate synthase [Thermoanaerobacterium thermosaccharolyticum]MBP2070930.1 3-deoxy-7-phosphoheptulonate synthase [Thermoanaerobacterium butyriciformans]
MVIIMKENATEENIKNVCEYVRKFNLSTHVVNGAERSIIGVIGNVEVLEDKPISSMEGVYDVVRISSPYKLVSRSAKPDNTVVRVKDVDIGGGSFVMMAGPCAIESYEQMLEAAKAVKKSGAKVLRGGAYKPRSSPYSFQGLEEEGLKILNAVGRETGMVTITEIVSSSHIEKVSQYADILQVGSRNMQNFELLKEIGKSNMPVLLKRGLSSTIEEWLNAAEYIMKEGNPNVILCERGIRTFETYTRNTLDLNAVAAVKNLSHLPVIVDPSHGTGRRDLIAPLSRAAVAVGADGLIIEVHPHPDMALSDGAQSLTPEEFDNVSKEVNKILLALKD